jgi:hypothetical protein
VGKVDASWGQQALLGERRGVNAVLWPEHAKETYRTLLGFPCLVLGAVKIEPVAEPAFLGCNQVGCSWF